MKKFWDWIKDDAGGRVLRLEGPIDSESFWGDEITPAMFRQELDAEDGDLTVWVNSPGGNVFAAAEIYTMLRDYKGAVTVKIASIAASAASVVAMAGNRVQMSPTGLLMIHDPSTIAMGNAKAMKQAITTLNEVKESIINAYAAKTGLRRDRIADLMEAETWMNAKKAVELGFADEILFNEKHRPEPEDDDSDAVPAPEALLYQSRVTDMAVLNSIGGLKETEPTPAVSQPYVPVIGMDGRTEEGAMPYEILRTQLDYLR